MDRYKKILSIRKKLSVGKVSLGSWMQISDPTVAEIIGDSGYDWVAVDLEHGSFGQSSLNNIFRSLELNNTLPLARIAECNAKDCKLALDAGAGGIIVPMVENEKQVKYIRDSCCWPPSGKRGIGFSRANLFGKKFNEYYEESQSPLLIVQIENILAVNNLEKILNIKGVDSILIGPYDLSASLDITGDFKNPNYLNTLNKIINICKRNNKSYGIHIVQPSIKELKLKINEGYQFIAYSIDSVFMHNSFKKPIN